MVKQPFISRAKERSMTRFGITGIAQILVCLLAVVTGSAVVISFGVFVPSFVEAYQSDVGSVSVAISLAILIVGLVSPILGRLLDMYSVRSLLTVGSMFLATGFLGVSFSQNVTQMLMCYVLLGLGLAAFAPLIAVKHMTVWFPDRIGLATSLVTLPVGAVLFPPLTQWLIAEFEWRQSFQIYALCTVVTMMTFLFLKSSPTVNGHAESADTISGPSVAEKLSSIEVYKPLISSWMFLFGVLAYCAFLAAPISIMAHFLVVAQDKGMQAGDGVQLLTIMGVASLVGAPLSGLISDYFGPRTGYVLLAVFQGSALVLLLGEVSYVELTISAIVLGFFMSASYVFFAAFIGTVIGAENFGTGFGLATLMIAVIGAFPPAIAGGVFDATGSYDNFFAPLAALTFLAGAGAWLSGSPKEVSYSQVCQPAA